MLTISQPIAETSRNFDLQKVWELATAAIEQFRAQTLADECRRTDTLAPVSRYIRRGLIFLWLMAGITQAATYYVSPSGDDFNTGTSEESAWQSIVKVNATKFAGGDNILFEGGQTFSGRIYLDAADTGSAATPITISSYGAGRATIDGGASNTLYAYNTAGINVFNMKFVGSGAETNSGVGIIFYCDLPGDVKLAHVHIDSVEISGFQFGIRIAGKNGLSGYDDVRLTRSFIHDNELDGVRTSGAAKYALTNVYVSDCEFSNNSGDPLLETNNGSGLVLGQVDGAIVERCLAHDNGALCTSQDGGCGIWCHDSRNVVIQSNESWSNRTAGPNDGGGFGLDGAVTQSILQYNYSHDNDGAGFGLYQYVDAEAWSNNIVRFNISQNDGRRNGFAGIQIANKSSAISDCEIYNNTIFMSAASQTEPRAVWFVTGSTNFHLRNNLFVTTDGVPVLEVHGDQSGWEFQGNVYWSSGAPLKILWSGLVYSDLASWRAYTGQETMFAAQLGQSVDPLLTNAGAGNVIGNPDSLSMLSAYALQSSSPLINSGMNLTEHFGIEPGPRDFIGNSLPQNGALDVGACEFSGTFSSRDPSPAPVVGLTVTSLRGNASTTGADKVSFSAVLGNLPVGFELAGQKFIADVGGASGTFTFDAKGRAVSEQGSARFKISRKKGKSGNSQSVPTVSIALVDEWSQTWTQRGIFPEADARDRVDVPVSFLFGDRVYASVLSAKRTVRAGKCKISK